MGTLKSSHLSFADRHLIQALLKKALTVKEIARALKKPMHWISREIARGGGGKDKYKAEEGQRRHEEDLKKIAQNPGTLTQRIEKLEKQIDDILNILLENQNGKNN